MSTEAAVLANGPETGAENAFQPQKLEWTVPRWRISHNWRRASAMVFGRGPVLRIVGTSLLAGLVICVPVQMAVPQLQLGKVWFALLFIPVIFAQIGFAILVDIAIRGRVTLTDEFLKYSRSNCNWRAKISEIESSQLVVYSAEHLALKLRPTNRREVTIALPSSTDLQLLASLLPEIDVVDKRTAFAAARAIVLSASSRARPTIHLSP